MKQLVNWILLVGHLLASLNIGQCKIKLKRANFEKILPLIWFDR